MKSVRLQMICREKEIVYSIKINGDIYKKDLVLLLAFDERQTLKFILVCSLSLQTFIPFWGGFHLDELYYIVYMPRDTISK